jgi:hypothetical protein
VSFIEHQQTLMDFNLGSYDTAELMSGYRSSVHGGCKTMMCYISVAIVTMLIRSEVPKDIIVRMIYHISIQNVVGIPSDVIVKMEVTTGREVFVDMVLRLQIIALNGVG